MTSSDRSIKKIALVLGSSGGIGRATVETLSDAGNFVVGIDTDARSSGACDLFVEADAADETSLTEAIAHIAAETGRIDHAINMVGIVGSGRLHETSLADWHHVLGVNLDSCFLLAKYVYPYLHATRGNLILCSSTNGLNGGSELSGAAYAAAKAAILNLNRYLAKEWATDGIRVNCVVPGPVDTPMLCRLADEQIASLRREIPSGRLVTAVDVAQVAAFLCSDAASGMTGTVANISGGLQLD